MTTTPGVRVYRRDIEEQADSADSLSRVLVWTCDRRSRRVTRILDESFSSAFEPLAIDPIAVRNRFVAYAKTQCDHYSACSLRVGVWNARTGRRTDRERYVLAFGSGASTPYPAACNVLRLLLSGHGDPVFLLDTQPTQGATTSSNEIRTATGALVATGSSGSIQHVAVDAGTISWQQDGAEHTAPLTPVDDARATAGA